MSVPEPLSGLIGGAVLRAGVSNGQGDVESKVKTERIS